MSRIGKLPIVLPAGVKCVYKAPKVTVEGPKGKLDKTLNFGGKIKTNKDSVTIISGEEDKRNKV